VESSAAAGVCEAIMVTIRGHATQKLLARESDEATMAASTTTSGGEWEGAEYWKDEHWRLALEELFYNDREKRKEKQDDMVFYVYQPNSSMDDNSNTKKWGRKKPIEKRSDEAALDVTVRRFGSGILRDTDLGGIRWMESVYLNILLHTTYTCTVAICSKAALERHKNGRAEPALPLYKTSRQVFASHTHISINLKPNASGKQKEFDYKNEVELAYPQVYFSIDDFEDAFEDLVVEDEDHCLCVLLYARDGPTFRWKGAKAGAAAGDGEKGSNNLGQNKKVSLFSGYVPYSHLRGATSKQGRGAGFLGMSTSSQAQPEQPEKLVMRGPGGKGHAEVAVTLLNRTTVVQPEEPKAEEKDEKREKGLKGFLAAAVQGNISLPILGGKGSGAAKPKVTHHIRCCLMNVSLPWRSLCHDILKASRV